MKETKLSRSIKVMIVDHPVYEICIREVLESNIHLIPVLGEVSSREIC